MINRFVQCFEIPSPDEQHLEFLRLLKGIGPTDAPALLDLLIREQNQGVFSEPAWHAFWARWGALDGATALDYHLSLPDSRWNGGDMALTMRGWAESNPAAAADWLRSHPDVRHQDNAFLGYVDGLASKDLRGATAMAIASIPNGDPMMARTTAELAEQAIRQGKLAGLQAWFDQLPADTDPGSARSAAVKDVWWQMQKRNFDAGVEWIGKQAQGPWRNDDIIREVAERLSAGDPRAALSWLEKVKASPSDGGYPGLGKVVENWTNRDAAGVEAWLKQPNGGALREQVLTQYNAYLARTNKGAARRPSR